MALAVSTLENECFLIITEIGHFGSQDLPTPENLKVSREEHRTEGV